VTITHETHRQRLFWNPYSTFVSCKKENTSRKTKTLHLRFGNVHPTFVSAHTQNKLIHTYVYTYMHTCIHTFKHTYIHTCMHACMHTYIHTYMHACILHLRKCTHSHKLNTGFFRRKKRKWCLFWKLYASFVRRIKEKGGK
jgi:hypothetical protein